MSELVRFDLHTHSTCSDGSLTPQELVRHAGSVGLQGLAIADHDTMDAFPLAKPIADEVGLTLIPAAEFSAVGSYEPVHILAYSYRLDDPTLQALCRRHQTRRVARNRQILDLLSAANMPVEEEELSQYGEGSVGRPHIAQAMIARGYVESVTEAFNRFLGEGKLCYAAGDQVTVQETLDAIHAANGLAVMAHPHLFKCRDTVAELLRHPFDGIEAYYARLPRRRENEWIELARGHSLLVTGGSDFHGDCKPTIPLGASWAPEESLPMIINRAVENGIFV